MKSSVVIFQKDLRLGGIQRSLINLLNEIDTNKYDVDLYLFSKDNFYSASFPPEINIIYQKKQSRFARFIPFEIYYRAKRVKVDKHYDIAIDYDGYQNITATYALKSIAKHRVYWVHNDLYIRHGVQNNYILKALYLMQHLLTRSKWRRFDTIVGVSDGVLDGFRKDFPGKKFVIIPNTINTKEILHKSSEKVTDLKVVKTKVNLTMLGRLEYQKGIDLLISKLPQVIERRQDIHLYIIGDGSMQKSLKSQVTRQGLDTYVTFLGAKKNPFKYLVMMDGLILYSRYEGQGMVLMEAKALGLPLYFPKKLEKYNTGLVGTNDIVETLAVAGKVRSYKTDRLEGYNKNIIEKINVLLTDN